MISIHHLPGYSAGEKEILLFLKDNMEKNKITTLKQLNTD